MADARSEHEINILSSSLLTARCLHSRRKIKLMRIVNHMSVLDLEMGYSKLHSRSVQFQIPMNQIIQDIDVQKKLELLLVLFIANETVCFTTITFLREAEQIPTKKGSSFRKFYITTVIIRRMNRYRDSVLLFAVNKTQNTNFKVQAKTW